MGKNVGIKFREKHPAMQYSLQENENMLSNVASSIYVPTIPPTINYETNKKINLAAIHYHYAKFQQLYDDHHSFQVTLSVANISFLVTGTYNSNKSKQWWLGYGFAGTDQKQSEYD